LVTLRVASPVLSAESREGDLQQMVSRHSE
jgi:hypothetical protein